MDFRTAPDPATKLAWAAPRQTPLSKTRTVAATVPSIGGHKLTVQTPQCAMRLLEDATRGSTTLLLQLEPDSDTVHAQFQAFVERCEEAATEACRVGGWLSPGTANPPAQPVPSIRDGGVFRLMAWGDGTTRWFDAEGALLRGDERLPSSAHGSCLVELGGAWITAAGTWGLKWKVAQVRFARVHGKRTAASAFGGGNEHHHHRHQQQYAFVDDS
jgi:hypothetical protein